MRPRLPRKEGDILIEIDGDVFYEMASINIRYEPLEALMLAAIGHDEDSWGMANGELRFRPFNPCRRYYYIGPNGGLISTDLGKEDD